MTTKAQRKMRLVAAQRRPQFALERSVLNAARALRGAIALRGITGVAMSTWDRFIKAEDALHDFHADRQRSASRSDSTNRTDNGGKHG